VSQLGTAPFASEDEPPSSPDGDPLSPAEPLPLEAPLDPPPELPSGTLVARVLLLPEHATSPSKAAANVTLDIAASGSRVGFAEPAEHRLQARTGTPDRPISFRSYIKLQVPPSASIATMLALGFAQDAQGEAHEAQVGGAIRLDCSRVPGHRMSSMDRQNTTPELNEQARLSRGHVRCRMHTEYAARGQHRSKRL
jgi:hypothetical protein